MKRSIALAVVLWVVLVTAAALHTYGEPGVTLNGGVYVNLPGGHWCGVEVFGTPGVFCDVN